MYVTDFWAIKIKKKTRNEFNFWCKLNEIIIYTHLVYEYVPLTGTVRILTTHGWCHRASFNYLLLYMSWSHVWYHNITISLYFNCKGEASTSVLPLYVTAALPDNGRNYRPKYFAVNAINKWIQNHFLIIKPTRCTNFSYLFLE